MFKLEDLSAFLLVFGAVASVAVFYFVFRWLQAKALAAEQKDRIIELQGELLKTKKSLEDLTKEHNHKYDPYSSQTTKSIILGMDKDGVIRSVNDYGVEFFGYENKDELIGKNLLGTLLPAKDSHGQNMTNLIERIKNNPRL